MGSKELEYFVSEKAPFAVVTFIGEMTKTTLSVLEDCQKDLTGRAATRFILVFRDVPKVELIAIRPLVALQKLMREKGALRTCSLRPDLMSFLLEKAAIRDSEYCNNLTDALANLKLS
jgi:anti-anti-sigma regulatory factor